MARNAEKAMTTLARWRAAKEAETGEKDRRPFLATQCTDLPRCEKYRLEIIREISKKVAQIQNAGLGEFRIRDLNDEINKLLREKRHWENQISSLGGPHYRRYGPKMFDAEGREVPGNRGYKYFGAAKNLPGVRELFEQEIQYVPKKNYAEMMKNIDAEYFGFQDDDDGILIPLEQKAEKEYKEKWMAEWRAKNGVEEGETQVNETVDLTETHIPTQDDIRNALLEKRKRELLQLIDNN